MESGWSREKGDSKRTKPGLNHSIYSISPSQQRCGPDRGLTSEGPCATCATWNHGLFEVASVVGSADESLGDLLLRQRQGGARGAGRLGCFRVGFDRMAMRVEGGGDEQTR